MLLDLADPEAAANLVSTALEHYGRIDVLVNNAGWAPARTALSRMSEDDLDRILAVNLRAPIAITRLAASAMTNQGGGTIVNIASAAAHKTPAGEAVYAAAKAGLVAFTHAAFAELRRSRNQAHGDLARPGRYRADSRQQAARPRAMLAPDDIAEAVMQIVRTPARACPVEIAIEPQADPMARPTREK